MSDIKAIRDRAHLYLSPEVAAGAGMTLAQLQQFIAYSFKPTAGQLVLLARRMGVPDARD